MSVNIDHLPDGQYHDVRPEDIHDLMRGHAERVAAYQRSLRKDGKARKTDPVPRGERAFTGAQRLKRWQAEDAMRLNREVDQSPIFTGPRSRRSYMSRLRELQLHPERLDVIRSRGRNVKAEGKVKTA